MKKLKKLREEFVALRSELKEDLIAWGIEDDFYDAPQAKPEATVANGEARKRGPRISPATILEKCQEVLTPKTVEYTKKEIAAATGYDENRITNMLSNETCAAHFIITHQGTIGGGKDGANPSKYVFYKTAEDAAKHKTKKAAKA